MGRALVLALALSLVGVGLLLAQVGAVPVNPRRQHRSPQQWPDLDNRSGDALVAPSRLPDLAHRHPLIEVILQALAQPEHAQVDFVVNHPMLANCGPREILVLRDELLQTDQTKALRQRRLLLLAGIASIRRNRPVATNRREMDAVREALLHIIATDESFHVREIAAHILRSFLVDDDEEWFADSLLRHLQPMSVLNNIGRTELALARAGLTPYLYSSKWRLYMLARGWSDRNEARWMKQLEHPDDGMALSAVQLISPDASIDAAKPLSNLITDRRRDIYLRVQATTTLGRVLRKGTLDEQSLDIGIHALESALHDRDLADHAAPHLASLWRKPGEYAIRQSAYHDPVRRDASQLAEFLNHRLKSPNVAEVRDALSWIDHDAPFLSEELALTIVDRMSGGGLPEDIEQAACKIILASFARPVPVAADPLEVSPPTRLSLSEERSLRMIRHARQRASHGPGKVTHAFLRILSTADADSRQSKVLSGELFKLLNHLEGECWVTCLQALANCGSWSFTSSNSQDKRIQILRSAIGKEGSSATTTALWILHSMDERSQKLIMPDLVGSLFLLLRELIEQDVLLAREYWERGFAANPDTLPRASHAVIDLIGQTGPTASSAAYASELESIYKYVMTSPVPRQDPLDKVMRRDHELWIRTEMWRSPFFDPMVRTLRKLGKPEMAEGIIKNTLMAGNVNLMVLQEANEYQQWRLAMTQIDVVRYIDELIFRWYEQAIKQESGFFEDLPSGPVAARPGTLIHGKARSVKLLNRQTIYQFLVLEQLFHDFFSLGNKRVQTAFDKRTVQHIRDIVDELVRRHGARLALEDSSTSRTRAEQAQDPVITVHQFAQGLVQLANRMERENRNFSRDQWMLWLLTMGQEYRVPICVAGGLGVLWLAALAIWIVRPIWIWSICQALGQQKLVVKGLEISPRQLLLIGILQNTNRVLDAWVRRQLPQIRERFNQQDTVRERELYVRVPVKIDGKLVTHPKVEDFAELFSDGATRLAIHGEGGSGKTSLAVQLARWGMDVDKNCQLARHAMVPVLIDDESMADDSLRVGPERRVLLGSDAAEQFLKDDNERLIDCVQGKLSQLVDRNEGVPRDLVKMLLSRKRLLVIIDHFSELNEGSRKVINPSRHGFPARALVVTSRHNERLGGVSTTRVQPQRVSAKCLLGFVHAYLEHAGVGAQFDDDAQFDLTQRLKSFAADRSVTVFLACRFLDAEISRARGDLDLDAPHNIPELMLYYIAWVNRSNEQPMPDEELLDCAQQLGWLCLRETFRPGGVRNEDCLQAHVSQDAFARLRDVLKILVQQGAVYRETRFALDPLAEYMAALFLVGTNKGDPRRWRQFFQDADSKCSGDYFKVRGFLAAVEDCCRHSKAPIPDFVRTELKLRIDQAVEPAVQSEAATPAAPISHRAA